MLRIGEITKDGQSVVLRGLALDCENEHLTELIIVCTNYNKISARSRAESHFGEDFKSSRY